MRGSAGNDGRGLGAIGVSLLCVLTLSGCTDAFVGMSMPSLPKIDEINPWAEKQVPLPGKRVAVIQQENISSNLAAADKPILLPPARENASWSQPGGTPSNAPGHLAFAGTTANAWSADAGKGSSFYGKLTASPIVYDDKVYTLDAAGKVSAFGISGGAPVWRVSTTPPTRRTRKGSAAGWQRTAAASTPAPATATWRPSMPGPEASCGRRTSRIAHPHLAHRVRRARVRDQQGRPGVLPLGLGRHGALELPRHARARQPALNASPAVDGDIVVVPYPSGDVVALRVSDGKPAWSESLARTRTGASMSAR